MGRVIAEFSDGSYVEYADGNFDGWCVFVNRPDAGKYNPKDSDYFQELIDLGKRYGFERVYGDFVKIYDLTTKKVEEPVLERINEIGSSYGEDSFEVSLVFTVIYSTMIAEENKAKTRLGKRIKRLGIHQALIEKIPAEDAAKFSHGKKWRDLSATCNAKGF